MRKSIPPRPVNCSRSGPNQGTKKRSGKTSAGERQRIQAGGHFGNGVGTLHGFGVVHGGGKKSLTVKLAGQPFVGKKSGEWNQ